MESSPGFGYDPDELAEIHVNEIKDRFSQSKFWEFEKVLGNGASGVTALIRDRDPLNLHNHKRVVLKRPLSMEWGAEELWHEINAFEMVRGNAHCVQMIAHCNDLGMIPRFNGLAPKPPKFRDRAAKFIERVRRAIKTPPNTIFEEIKWFEGPAVLLEYLENGSLLRLRQRKYELNVEIPNRLLWRWYFCLVRACIGFAYPAGAPEGAPPVLERIPAVRAPLRGIVHGDIAARNLVIGDRDPSLDEHQLVPQLKMIDFGRMHEDENKRLAVLENIFRVSMEIINLILGWQREMTILDTVIANGIRTCATDILSHAGVVRFPYLDPELRDLLIEATAVDPNFRPSLREMDRRVRNGMSKPPDLYPGRALEESNYAIETLLQQLTYDA
ncbi:hypothetical protein F5Y19DRAFT_468348 [Xylariaceae sp. FL1651]|nr:hypothetical protein F5Y19DRAFT_468348 [Xylariaceae sp. FL1651]